MTGQRRDRYIADGRASAAKASLGPRCRAHSAHPRLPAPPAILARDQHVPDTDFASSPAFRTAVSRARWAVIQTGLITSGLALFGVYVLATRINDLHLMSMYAPEWLPSGPMLVGLISGSGYILASWWFGVRVGPGMLAGIVLLQLGVFIACHYADFETRDLIYRDTGQAVGFHTFFDHTTRQLARDPLDPTPDPPPWQRGYTIRAAEAGCFVAGGMLAALTLVGRPKCARCGGLVRRRSLGRIGGPRVADTIKRLEERARLGDARGFSLEIANHAPASGDDPAAIELTLSRCDVCGAGPIERTDQRGATNATSSSTSSDPPWRIDACDEFARQLFEDANPAAAAPRPSDSPV